MDPETFFCGDSVLFDDGGAAQPVFDLLGFLRQAGILINTDMVDYTLQGNGTISGSTGLTKNGAADLTINGSHDFTGGVAINGGIVFAGSNQALGANGQNITIAAGAELDINGAFTTNRDYAATIAGSGSAGDGAITNFGDGHLNGFGSPTLAADATIGGIGQWDVRPITAGTSVADLGGLTLTKKGSNKVAIVDGSMTEPGVIDPTEGALAFTRMKVELAP